MNENPKEAEGRKKCPLDLVPSRALMEVAWALANGAEKYGAHNFAETGVKASTYKAANGRHMEAWYQGEDLDPESLRHHLAHAAASAMIALDCYLRGNLEDDRPG